MRLRPQFVLGLREIAPLAAVAIRHLPGAVGLGKIAGTSTPRLINDVDRVTLAHEILCPAFAAIGSTEEGGGGAGAAVDHDDGIGLSPLCRNADVHVHLARHVGAAIDDGGLASDVEEAFARER